MNAARISRPRQKCTMFANTLTMGSTSAGNSTFLIRLPPVISAPLASMSDAENHVHGSRPQKKKTEYGVVSLLGFGMIFANTNEYTDSSSSGLTNDQKNPSTDPR